MRAVLETEPVDIVVLDVMMPGEDGLTIARSANLLPGEPPFRGFVRFPPDPKRLRRAHDCRAVGMEARRGSMTNGIADGPPAQNEAGARMGEFCGTT